MKAAIYIYIDDYQINVSSIKNDMEINIKKAIYEFIKQNGYNFIIEIKRYVDPVALNVPADFIEKYGNTRIHLPSIENTNKNVKIKFEYIDSINHICECTDIFCVNSCHVLYCGCFNYCNGDCQRY